MTEARVPLVRLSVVVPAESEEIVTAAFLREDAAARATGLVVEDSSVGQLAIDERTLAPGDLRMSVYLPEPEAAGVEATLQARLAALCEMDLLAEVPAIDRTPVEAEDWQNRWREFFHVTHVSERVVVRPPWREYEAQGDEVVIDIEPGLAFGTGGHQTTQLCLGLLDRTLATVDPTPSRLIDVGCGSGVLAVAGVMLGVPHADAMDVDPAAWEATRDNARVNGVAEGVTVIERPLSIIAQGEPYPLVLANIISGTLLELRDDLLGVTAPGGLLMLSGLLVEERDAFLEAFGDGALLELIDEEHLDEWMALVYRRSGDAA